MAAHTEFLLPGRFIHMSAEVYSDAAVLLLDMLAFLDAATPAGTAVVSFAAVVDLADSAAGDFMVLPESAASVWVP